MRWVNNRRWVAAAYLSNSAISASAFSSQYVISISRYIAVAVARCFWASSRLSVRL
jgi:hypothetical protein